jgi:hypothetical protein
MIAESLPLMGITELDRIEAQLQSRLNGRVRGFRLVLRDKGLLLLGYAHTYHAKQLAQHALMEATGVPILANDIQVF